VSPLISDIKPAMNLFSITQNAGTELNIIIAPVISPPLIMETIRKSIFTGPSTMPNFIKQKAITTKEIVIVPKYPQLKYREAKYKKGFKGFVSTSSNVPSLIRFER
jgi:hypothetical protein